MSIDLQPANEGDSDFAFRVKKLALGPFIETRWGWHEDYQRNLHDRDWREKPWTIILRDGVAVGIVSVDRRNKLVRLGGLYLVPEHQGQGVGAQVLTRILRACDRDQRDCQVSIPEGNRAITLFKRLGFREVGNEEGKVQLLRNWRYQ